MTIKKKKRIIKKKKRPVGTSNIEKKPLTVADIIGKEKLDSFVKYFGMLYGRWQDEKEYEDFDDYKKAAEKNVTSKQTPDTCAGEVK